MKLKPSSLADAEVRSEWSYTSTPICLYGVDGENLCTSICSRRCATELLVEEQGLCVSDTILMKTWTSVRHEVVVYSVSARIVVLGEVPGSNTFHGFVYLNLPVSK